MSNTIRPASFDEIIGQDSVITRLRVSMAGCKNNGTVMPHVLIDGPPGLGKTTIASAISNELGVNLCVTNAASIRSIKNIMPYIMGLSPRSVLFIDEIHRLPKIVEEFLYSVMEDFAISVISKNDEDKDIVDQIDIPSFTLVGATTSGGSLSQPFYDRFTIKEHLTFYTSDDLAKVARLNCNKMGIVIDDSDLFEIAKRSKGTPRILNGRLLWYRNYLSCYPTSGASIDEIFSIQGIDENGFDVYDRMYLDILKKSKGSPLGLKSISSITGIAIETIENSIEPYLVRSGTVIRTSKGRIINTK